MRTASDWFAEYGQSHQHPTNKAIHWVCVPTIMFCVVGLLWALPVPLAWQLYPLLNFGSLFLLAALLFYFRISAPLALGMLLVACAIVALLYLLQRAGARIWLLSLVLFVAAWLGQFYGHKVEGKKPSFLKDVQFLLIGPLWLLAFVYRRAGIAY